MIRRRVVRRTREELGSYEVEIQEIDCELCGRRVECYDVIAHYGTRDPATEDPLTIYCQKHEAEDLLPSGRDRGIPRAVRDLLKTKGLWR